MDIEQSGLSDKFSIENLQNFLSETKDILIKMNILLDTNEINKCLSTSLNRELLKNNIDNENIFNHINNDWDNISTLIPTIENNVREFNKSENYKYYVDMEEVLYIMFYRQIKYVKNILNDTIKYLNSNVNLIYIYTFVIQAFYDEPIIYSENYMFILGKLLETADYSDMIKLKDFFSPQSIKKLTIILKLLYDVDGEFIELIKKIDQDKITFIKIDIEVPTSNSNNNFNCSSSDELPNDQIEKKDDETLRKLKETKDSKETIKYLLTSIDYKKTRDIELIEKDFYKLKCDLLFRKREIDLESLYKQLNSLFNSDNIITKELWLGFMLYLYKKFIFDFELFSKNIIEKLSEYSLTEDYHPKINTFKDLNLPDRIYMEKDQTGGSNYLNDKYRRKYLKYKAKYLQIKNF